jgi:glycosyltransferase involved in cell wall biosynthesis
MSFLVITHVKHSTQNGKIYAYGPYVREMNLWFKYVGSVIVMAPLDKTSTPGAIDLAYTHPHIRFIAVPEFHFTTISAAIKSLMVVPYILVILWLQMSRASHIHLRCPGNMGLLGCLVQILFPWKKKTAKYAGNWDWNSKQPLSYRMQQRILRNTILTHNMKALVYGEWPDRTKNILPFFTASYSEADKISIPKKSMEDETIRFIFVGTLTLNKQPLLALEVFHELTKKLNRKLEMHFYGEGNEKAAILAYCESHQLQHCVCVHGNVDSDTLKHAYIQSHFLLFFSKSEGWPKAVSEAMWWGCVPVTTPVSCVEWMLYKGENGILVKNNNEAIASILKCMENPQQYRSMSARAIEWSRNYTLETFEQSIKKLV